jgi:hypothetical protein
VVEPVKKAFRCGIKSLFIVYVMYGISPIGSWIRMAVNSVMLKQDKQHLEFTFFQGIFGFYPILIVLGSRLLLVSTLVLFTLENSINFIRVSILSIRKTGVNLTNKSIGSSDEFEAQITKSELLHLLDHQKDQKSHLFSLSGTPKQPKMWNEIVGSTISNIDSFIDSNLTNSKTNKPGGKLDKSNTSKITSPTAAEESVNVKIWSDQRRRILGSSLLAPSSRKVVEENNADKIGKIAADKAKKELSEVAKSTSVILKERADKLTKNVVEQVQKSVKRVHHEFDSMLGIDVYDKVKNEKMSARKQSLYNICQNVGILGEMAVAMSMYDTKVHVSFQSQYPIYKILETLLRLLKSIETYEADSQKNVGKSASGNGNEPASEISLPLHGLDTLKDDVTGAIVKILHAFGRHTIESDFKRIELRPYYENYREIISN